MSVDINERLLAMMAVEKGLITEKQLTECLNIQDFFDERPLVDILLEKNYLTEKHVERLREIMEKGISGSADDAGPKRAATSPFGVLAIRSKYIDLTQLQEGLDEQKTLQAQGTRFLIGQILMSKGYLTPIQIRSILIYQGKNYLRCCGCGVGYTVIDFNEDEFYRCRKCNADLEQSEPTPIARSVIERHLSSKASAADADEWTFESDEEDDRDEEDTPDLLILDI